MKKDPKVSELKVIVTNPITEERAKEKIKELIQELKIILEN